MDKAKVLSFFQKYAMIIVLIAVAIFFNVMTDGKILYPQNMNNLISQNAYVFVLATGMLLCILTGGNIDLSVGSVVCFTGCIGAVLLRDGTKLLPANVNIWVSVLVMLIVGTLVGVLQGFFIAYVKIPPFIATLAGMYAFRGLSNVVLQGFTVAVNDETFLNVFGGGADCYVPDFKNYFSEEVRDSINSALGAIGLEPDFNLTCMVAGIIAVLIYIGIKIKGRISASKQGYETEPLVPEIIKLVIISVAILWVTFKLSQYKGIITSLIWILLVLLIYSYITTKTTMGRYLYAVGGNEKATRLSGINTKIVYLFAYINMGLLAGLAGILVAARATSAQPTYGQGYEMDAIAACFIGGASAYGGIGKVSGVVIGAVLMGVINQGMLIMGTDANYQKVVKGLVLLFAVMFDVISKKEKK